MRGGKEREGVNTSLFNSTKPSPIWINTKKGEGKTSSLVRGGEKEGMPLPLHQYNTGGSSGGGRRVIFNSSLQREEWEEESPLGGEARKGGREQEGKGGKGSGFFPFSLRKKETGPIWGEGRRLRATRREEKGEESHFP